MVVRRSLTVPAALVLAWAAAGCDIAVDRSGGLGVAFASARAQDEWTRSYQIAAGGCFELVNVNGRIAAEATDGDAVEVKAERTAKAGSDERAKELLGRIEMLEEVGGDRVRVEVRVPRMSTGGHEVRWTVRVPKGVHVDLRTVNGSIEVQELQGDVRVSAVNGRIKGRVAATGLDASVTNGGIEIDLLTAPTAGTFSLESVNGGVRLGVPAETKAEISARVVNGGITVDDLDLVVTGERTRRRLTGTLNGGGARVSLETTNGGARISRVTGS